MKQYLQKGITLVEIIIASGIAMVLGVMLVSSLVNQTGVFYKQSSVVSSGLNLNDAISEIEKTIRQSSAVVASYPLANPEYTTSTTTLVLKSPSYNAQGEVVPNTYDYIVITADNNDPKLLRLKYFPDAFSAIPSQDKILTNLLSAIEFKYLNKNGDQVSPAAAFQIESTVYTFAKNGSIGITQSTSIVTTLRNL